MQNKLAHYASTADWRKTVRRNEMRTTVIICLFFLVYLSIGLLVDVAILSQMYPKLPVNFLFQQILLLRVFPLATVVLLLIAAISLLVTYSMYDTLMFLGTDHHEVTAHSGTHEEKQLYNVVEELRIAAGLRYTPKVYLINAAYMNAFATGYSEKSAIVAITRGLMQKLTRDELQAVMAHELSHIRHLDIKITLTASMLANLSIIVLDILFRGAYFNSSRERSNNKIMLAIVILRFLLPVVTLFMLLYLSRTREVMADAGCVELMRNNQPLASALIKIAKDHKNNLADYNIAYGASPHEHIRREVYFFDPTEAGIYSLSSINDLFSTHPSLETRLALLGVKWDPEQE